MSNDEQVLQYDVMYVHAVFSAFSFYGINFQVVAVQYQTADPNMGRIGQADRVVSDTSDKYGWRAIVGATNSDGLGLRAAQSMQRHALAVQPWFKQEVITRLQSF